MTDAVQNLEQLSIRELTERYNALAVTLEQPQVKRVESKAKGIEKIQALQALIASNANGATGDSEESEFSESEANAELNAEQGATEPAAGVEAAAELSDEATESESDAGTVEQPETGATDSEQPSESDGATDEETDENEEEQNAAGNAAMAAMANPGAILQGVMNAMNKAQPPAPAAETPAAPVAKKPASNALGVSESWNDPDVANARRTRHSVFVECEGVKTSHKSVPQAFRDLRIPMTGLIAFRLKVKDKGVGTYEYNGKKYNFTVDQVYGPNAPKPAPVETAEVAGSAAEEQKSDAQPEQPQMPQDTDLGETNTGEQAAA